MNWRFEVVPDLNAAEADRLLIPEEVRPDGLWRTLAEWEASPLVLPGMDEHFRAVAHLPPETPLRYVGRG